MARSEIPFIDLIKESWPFFQSNLVVTIGVPAFLSYVPLLLVGVPTFIVAFLAGIVVGMMNKNMVGLAMVPIGLIAVPLFAAVYNAARAGWTVIMLKMMRGENAKFMDIKTGMPWFMNFFLTMLIIGVGTTIGSFCLIVPGIFFAVRTSFAPFLVIEKNLGPIEAILKSNEIVTGYSWQILGYFALYAFANLVAGLIPIANIILPVAAMGFFDLVLARIYLYRTNEDVVMP